MPFPAVLSLLLVVLPSVLHVRDERPETPLDPALVPATGPTPQAFVPKGWKVEEQIDGDLNNDRRADVVLDLIEDLPEYKADGTWMNRLRSLVVLFREADDTLRRVAVGPSVLLCSICGWMYANPSGVVSIENGTMVVRQLAGSRVSTDHSQSFRWNAGRNTMLMIGERFFTHDREEKTSEEITINYLTGVRLVERSVQRRGDLYETRISRKRTRIPARPLPVERVDPYQ